MSLSGCAKTNYKKEMISINLPSMPIAGIQVAEELELVCIGEKCSQLSLWLNQLIVFKKRYNIYQQELLKGI